MLIRSREQRTFRIILWPRKPPVPSSRSRRPRRPDARRESDPDLASERPATADPARATAEANGGDDCKREENRLAELGAKPSGEAISDFLKTSRCDQLWPRVLALIEDSSGSSKAEATAADSQDSSPDIVPENEAGPSAAPAKTLTAPESRIEAAAPRTNVASMEPGQGAAAGVLIATAPDDDCRRDGQRLEKLRSNPSKEEAARFARELRCESLRPQISRLADSLNAVASAPLAPDTPSPTQAPARGPETASACAADQDILNRLRMQPSPQAAQQLWRNLRCERLRPQVRLVLESLDLTADPSGACRREAEELKRIRSHPDRREAEDFVREIRCADLKPQAARLLESLSE